jgi:fucose permease
VAVKVIGFVILGAALGGVFPALIALTPDRVGSEHAARVIAWQIGAAASGGAAISAIIGLFIDAINLSVLGPSLTALAVVLVIGSALLDRFRTTPQSATPSRASSGTER